ncbi:MAG: hypothetical protein WC340_13270 [Kiritimatiellia bacterium]
MVAGLESIAGVRVVDDLVSIAGVRVVDDLESIAGVRVVDDLEFIAGVRVVDDLLPNSGVRVGTDLVPNEGGRIVVGLVFGVSARGAGLGAESLGCDLIADLLTVADSLSGAADLGVTGAARTGALWAPRCVGAE